MKNKILIRDPEIQKKINSSLNQETWPLENYLMIVYVNSSAGKFLNDDFTKIIASNRFYLADHDLTSENAVTFIRHENVITNIANSTLSDFDKIDDASISENINHNEFLPGRYTDLT